MGMRTDIGWDADVVILVVVVAGGLKIPETKYNRTNKMKRKKSMGHAERMSTSKMKRTTIYLPPGGIRDDNNSDDDEVSSSSVIVMIVTLIKKHTKILYHYTNLDLPTFFCKKSNILFACYGIITTLNVYSGSLQLRDTVLRLCHSRVTKLRVTPSPFNIMLN